MYTLTAPRRRTGFALVELMAAMAVVGLLAAVLLVTSGDSRRRARLAGSIANLQEFAVGTQAYAADNADRFWTFSWRAGVDYGFGGVAGNDNEAATHQAVEILRRRAGRTDIGVIFNWFPYNNYNQLVLADYLDRDVLAPAWISPEDRNRLGWRRDPLAYFSLTNRPNYPAATNDEKRWPYSSSYEMGPAFVGPDAVINGVPTIAQDPNGHRFYQVGNSLTRLGQRHGSEVAFPSRKAMLYEQNQRFFGERDAFFMYREARIPILFADGSVSVRSMDNANNGFQPNSPLSSIPTRLFYTPDTNWESPTLNGAPAELVIGRIRWTRSGLRGRDFGGPEVPWAPP